jgi:altronate dehydratase small subunit
MGGARRRTAWKWLDRVGSVIVSSSTFSAPITGDEPFAAIRQPVGDKTKLELAIGARLGSPGTASKKGDPSDTGRARRTERERAPHFAVASGRLADSGSAAVEACRSKLIRGLATQIERIPSMRNDAVAIKAQDNVATALRALRKEEIAAVGVGEQVVEVVLAEDVEFGHKFALIDIVAGDDIIKYGEVIGRATRPIPVGAHAHVHNVESLRGRGDLS